jgi:hypothetical protein
MAFSLISENFVDIFSRNMAIPALMKLSIVLFFIALAKSSKTSGPNAAITFHIWHIFCYPITYFIIIGQTKLFTASKASLPPITDTMGIIDIGVHSGCFL